VDFLLRTSWYVALANEDDKEIVGAELGAGFVRKKKWCGPYATPNQRHVDFVLIFRDQEAVGSNPIAPTTPFKINSLLLPNPAENANERLVQNHVLSVLSLVRARLFLLLI
jgi:hypothetical protein